MTSQLNFCNLDVSKVLKADRKQDRPFVMFYIKVLETNCL